MKKILTVTREEARARVAAERKTAEYKVRMARLRDEDIDFSDAPEITEEDVAAGKVYMPGRGGARVGAGRKRVAVKKKFTSIAISFATAKLIRDKALEAGVTIDDFLRCRVA